MSDGGTFEFEGRRIPFRPGDTLASALLRAGVTIFSRGPKYHRPRGPFCLAGHCGQCGMRVDGEPNVTTCTTPCREGGTVQRQNALGSADRDLLRAVDYVYRQGLDHHHLMVRYRVLNQAAQFVARRLSGIGDVPDTPAVPAPAQVVSRPLVVIGAGPAGLAAARAAQRCGIPALVLETRGELGGHVADGLSVEHGIDASLIGELANEVRTQGEIRTDALAFGLYAEGNRRYVVARVENRLWEIETERVIVATGSTERAILFESNDLPGVFGGRGLLRLIRRHGVVPGRRAVVLGSSADAVQVARGLDESGIEVVAIVDPASKLDEAHPAVRSGWQLVRALGSRHVEGVVLIDPNGREERIGCDLVATTAALQPAYDLAAAAGAKVEYRPEAGGFAVVLRPDGSTNVEWLFAAGALTGEPLSPIASGELAGLAAAASLRPEDDDLRHTLRRKILERQGEIARADRIRSVT